MKRTLILSVIGILAAVCASGQTKIDTLYYDKDGRGINKEDKIVASYYRITAAPSDSTHPKKCWDYYVTGEPMAESDFIKVDKNDDANTILNGEYISYYKSGGTMEKCSRADGLLNGEYYKYDETGLILEHGFYKAGKRDGIYTEFKEDGNLCVQLQFDNGVILYDYYEVTNSEGFYSKLSIHDDSPVYDIPTMDDMKTEYKQDVEWHFYDMNGMTIALTCSKTRDYGKYYKISVILGNFTMAPIEFNIEGVSAVLNDGTEDGTPMTVYSAEEYMKKVKKQQNWAMALNAVAAGLNASNAAYTTTTVSTYSHGHTYTHVATTYNATAAYQANVIASNQVSAYDGNLLADREIKDEGYLKRNTLYPGDSISGYINIGYMKGDSMTINFQFGGVTYQFPYQLAGTALK